MPKIIGQMFSIFGHLTYICNVKQKEIRNETFLKETKITKTQTKSRDMKVILQEGFTYKAEFLIEEEAYAKLLSAAETFGNNNAAAMLGLYIESKVHNLKDVDKYAMMMLKNSIISFETHFPSNFVTITARARECEAEVDPQHEKYEDVIEQLERAFRWRVDILRFISGELDCVSIMNKE